MKIGDKARAFTLKNQFGNDVDLSDFLGRQSIVLFFYPKDHTPGCTKEACSFRDYHSEFEELGCKIFGISGDSVEKHRSFAEKFHLKYDLLADTKKTVRNLYKVPAQLFGLIPGRVTYIIDKDGIIQGSYNSQTQPLNHISKALEKVRSL